MCKMIRASALALWVVTILPQSQIVNADDLVIEEIMVTAQKKAESSQDVPISMSVFSGKDIEKSKIRSTMEVAAQVPNMMIIGNFGDSLPVMAIRGVTQADYNLNQNSPIGLYVDDVYKGPLALSGMQLYDIERVEVLRGPQGTLYGKNTTGGAVSFHSRTPDFEPDGYLTVGAGNYSRREVKAAFETPLLAEKLAARAALVYNRADGYVDNKLPGGKDPYEIDEWAGRLTFKAVFSDDLQVVLRLHKSASNPLGSTQFSREVIPGLGVGFTGYNRKHLDLHETESNFVGDRTMENEGANLTINWNLDDVHTLTSVTAYDEGLFNNPEDSDGSPFQVLEITYLSEVRQYTQELRISSDYSGALNWIAGLYFAREDNDLQTENRFFEMLDVVADPFDPAFSPSIFRNQYSQRRDSVAAFGQVDVDLSEKMALAFGLRYSKDDSEMTDMQSSISSAVIGDLGALGVLIPPQPKDDFSDSKVTGRLALNYFWSDSVMTYISYSQGYRNGVFNGSAFLSTAELTQADPEEVDAFEVGFKTQFLDNRVQLNGAVFYYDYTDQQFIDVNAMTLTQIVRNAGESEVLGFELELMALASDKLTLQAGLGYLDTEYKNLTLNGADLSGNELINAPKWNVNLSLDYVIFDLDVGEVIGHLDTSFTDEHHSQATNVERNEIEEHWLTNLRLGFESNTFPYSVGLWVRNVTNEEFETVTLDLADTFNMDVVQVNTPRTFGVDVTYHWN